MKKFVLLVVAMAAAFAAVLFFSVNVIYVIVAAALVGIALELVHRTGGKQP